MLVEGTGTNNGRFLALILAFLGLLLGPKGTGRIRLCLILYLVGFQTSDALIVLKIAFLGVVAISFAAGLRRASTVLVLSGFLGCVVAVVRLAAGILDGRSATDVVKDSIPVFVAQLAPVALVVLYRRFPPDLLLRHLMSVAALLSVSTTLTWMVQRGIVNLTYLPPFIYTFVGLAVCALSLTLVFPKHAVDQRSLNRALMFLAATLLTGTRTVLLLLPSVLWAYAARTKRWLKSTLAIVGMTLAIAALATLVLPEGGRQQLLDRFEFSEITQSGSASSQSLVERGIATNQALEAFDANPFFGSGLGQQFRIFDYEGRFKYLSIRLDSPYELFGDWGLMALVFYVCAAVALGSLLLPGDRKYFLLLAIAASLATPPIVDNGFFIGCASVVIYSRLRMLLVSEPFKRLEPDSSRGAGLAAQHASLDGSRSTDVAWRGHR